MTPQDIRLLAGELRSLANRIDDYVDEMQNLGMDTMRPLIGNWDYGTGVLKNFLTKQIFNKLIDHATKSGKDAHDVMWQILERNKFREKKQ